MKRLVYLLACLSVLLVVGCAPTFEADVTHFNALPGNVSGRSFAILPDQGQTASLEFEHYAQQVAGVLLGYGLRGAPAGNAVDLVVLMHYGSAGSQTQFYYDPGPYMGPWGYGWYGPGWYGGEWRSYTTYSQLLEVEILDGPAWRAGQRHMLWQGRAISDTGIRDFTVAMPYLVRALFQGFPGVSGQTQRVSLPIG